MTGPRPSRRWGAVWVALAIAAGLGAFVATQVSVTSDITHFLPPGEDQAEVELARQLTASELSRTMVILIEAPDEARALAASRAMEAALRDDPHLGGHLSFIEASPPDGVDEALWELYHPRRLAFVAPTPEAAAERASDAGLEAAAERLTDRLASPMSTMLSRVAPADPMLALPGLFEGVAARQGGGVAVVDGRLVTEDGRHAVLFLGTTAPSFEGAAQRVILDGVDAAFAETERAVEGPLTMSRSGANRFAVAAEAAIKADIARVSTLSVVGLLLIFLWLFRSPRLVLLIPIPIGAGMLVGTAGALAIFGEIHGLTLAFGAALMGVSIDYAAHFYSHHVAGAERGARATMRQVWPGLALGAATTIAGFTALAISSFPGLRELAVFAALGIAGALAATRVCLPALVPPRPPRVRAARRLAAGLMATLSAMDRRRWIPGLVVAGAAVAAAVGLPALTWQDDLAQLGDLDPALLAEDEDVRERVVRYEQRRFVVALGDDEEAALRVNDAASEALAEAEAAGELGAHRTLADLLPSARRQAAVWRAFTDAPRLWERFEEIFAEAGFDTDAFAPFRAALDDEPPAPLTWDALASSPLAPLVRSFRVGLDDRVGVLTFLHDVRDADALSARIDAVDGASLVDVQATFADAYRAYRGRMLELLLWGLGLVCLLIVARYRDLRRTAAAFVPAVLAALVTVALLSLAEVPLNALTLTALLMIVSMGVDYGVFLAESSPRRAGATGPEAMAATLLALFVACVSTVLGFGLLALSSHPALSSLGLTAAIGVVTSLIVAPSVLVLAGAHRVKEAR